MGNGVDRVDIRYMGRKSPPLATMSSGSLSLYLATEYKGKVPILGGSSESPLPSGILRVR